MKTMKIRLLSLLFVLTLTAGLSLPALAANELVAQPTAQSVLVDGKTIAFDAYYISGNNYFKLRDIAYTLNGTDSQFNAEYDAAANAIVLTTAQAYTVVGGEMQGKGSGNQTPQPSAQKVSLDGKPLSAAAYYIKGNNYFKLRDLGQALGFEVQFDAKNSCIRITSGLPYTGADYQEEEARPMSVTSAGVNNGVLDDKYGARGTQKLGGVPTRSMPLSIADAPKDAVSFAVVMMDPDSKPLCGYEWVHWLAANFESADIPENASIAMASAIVQGLNDFGKTGYGGPTPPDKPHTYVITVYALDTRLDLDSGFSKTTLEKAMAGHILAQAELRAKYSN